MDITRLYIPSPYTGADISSQVSADGTIFVSYQSGGIQRIYKQAPGATSAEPVDLPQSPNGVPLSGRGQLSVDGGQLYLTCWSERETPRLAFRVGPIPGFVAPNNDGATTAMVIATDDPMWDIWETGNYTSENLTSPDPQRPFLKVANSMNIMKAALLSMRDKVFRKA